MNAIIIIITVVALFLIAEFAFFEYINQLRQQYE